MRDFGKYTDMKPSVGRMAVACGSGTSLVDRNVVVKFSIFVSALTAGSVIGYFAFIVLNNAELKQFRESYDVFINELLPITSSGAYNAD